MLPLEKGMLGLAGWATSYKSVHRGTGLEIKKAWLMG